VDLVSLVLLQLFPVAFACIDTWGLDPSVLGGWPLGSNTTKRGYSADSAEPLCWQIDRLHGFDVSHAEAGGWGGTVRVFPLIRALAGIPKHQCKRQLARDQPALWIMDLVLFVVLLLRLLGIQRNVPLVVAAGQPWGLTPLLSRSVSQHGWGPATHSLALVGLGCPGSSPCCDEPRRPSV
jgi:hypothetical protein